jgi:hypothetical protein
MKQGAMPLTLPPSEKIGPRREAGIFLSRQVDNIAMATVHSHRPAKTRGIARSDVVIQRRLALATVRVCSTLLSTAKQIITGTRVRDG